MIMNKFDISTTLRLGRTFAVGAALTWLFAAPAFATNLEVDGNLAVGGNATVTGNETVTGALINSGIGQTSLWPRNLIDNGAMLVIQRPAAGTAANSTATCGTTSGVAITSYSADRWGCDVNVTSGIGVMAPATATPTPPAGFTEELKLYKNSSSLAQPVCAWQEIQSSKVAQAAGQFVMLSGYIAAMANLAADGGNSANLVILTGTVADQGLGVLRSAVGMTASPAITPVWTGLATLQSTAATISTTYGRYNGAAVQVPAAALEMAVGICFTPGTAAGSATDGIAFTGVQLEIAASTQTAPSNFENRPYNFELTNAQHEFYAIAESATSGATQSPSGQGASTTTCTLNFPFPVTMDVAPTFTAYGASLSTSTWTITHVVTATALATTYLVTQASAGNTINSAGMTATVASGLTVGQTCVLTSANGTSVLTWSADF
jgi:hypothetical protein